MRCISSTDLAGLEHRPEFTPRVRPADAAQRRERYRTNLVRQRDEREWIGPKHDFLASLAMTLRIAAARPDDLDRAEELTLRTSQLNTTGRAYSRAELAQLCGSPDHRVLVASLEDRYGTHGIIGLVVLHCESAWTIKLLLVSCRVMSTGAGTALLTYVQQSARAASVELLADFVANDRNRIMYVTYKLAGFAETKQEIGPRLSYLAETPPNMPPYINVEVLHEGWADDLPAVGRYLVAGRARS